MDDGQIIILCWVGEWMDVLLGECMDGRFDGWIDMGGWMDGRFDGWMDVLMGGWMDRCGWMDG